jgi:hypothetical protein
MDQLLNLINPHTLDTILSDPLLLVGASLVVLGTLLFLFSAVKFLRYNKSHSEFAVPVSSIEEDIQAESASSMTNGGHEHHRAFEEPPASEQRSEPVEPASEPAPVHAGRFGGASDQTMVMPPGVADLQAQFEIAISQIKQLNKKVFELERQLETLSTRADVSLEPNELKEPPADPADYTKKLLKVVEHVIVLEKEMAKLRSEKEPSGPAAGHKPPIMPL